MLRPLLILVFLICACGNPEFSPWQTEVESEDLTAKHLEWLGGLTDSFEPFKIALTGDPQAVVGHLRRVVDVTNRRDDLSFITILGDITDLGLRREWIWIDDTIKKSNKPFLTVVGNHDGLTEGDGIYKKMFGPLNYSFIYKDVKFIMWNNNYFEWGDPDFNWLEKEVLSHHRVIVMSHQPPYSGTLKDYHEQRWKQIRTYSNYQASIHGHVHNYSYKIEKDTDTIIYTVDRVTGTHFGILQLKEDSIVLENCTPLCRAVQ